MGADGGGAVIWTAANVHWSPTSVYMTAHLLAKGNKKLWTTSSGASASLFI
jgi:hypothetical protein